ncbi:hypothetical protein tb265_06950 [Gemmatimonadetes bacterium T265]|nr:hypothetical protein tb265_06950 [Gemmatimonadetes bacterium T265]
MDDPDVAPPAAPATVLPATVLPAFRDGLYQAVRAAWRDGHAARHPQYPPLERALERLARAARDHGIVTSAVLRTLDAVCRPADGGDDALDWDHVREWAGGVVIRAYYRAD